MNVGFRGKNMTNYKMKHGDMELWLILAALGEGEQRKDPDAFTRNPDGSLPIKFEVGGVELDFSAVAKRIDKSLDDLVKDKAQRLLDDKYSKLIDRINDIQENLAWQKETLFKYSQEEN